MPTEPQLAHICVTKKSDGKMIGFVDFTRLFQPELFYKRQYLE